MVTGGSGTGVEAGPHHPDAGRVRLRLRAGYLKSSDIDGIISG